MPLFFAELGRHPALSLAEIAVRSAADGHVLRPRLTLREMTLLDGDAPDAGFAAALGGILRFGEILETHDGSIAEDDVVAAVTGALAKRAGGGKIVFGISAAALAPNVPLPSPAKLRAWGLSVKKEVRASGSARLLTSRDRLLSPVAIAKNDVIAAGGDFIIFTERGRWHLGRTTFVHDFEGQARREFGRPAANPTSGMLPVQLARILVNLAGGPRGTLLDPFCGSGTLLGEAALTGWRRIIGSDISPQEVDATRQNLAWLASTAGLVAAPELFVSPVEGVGAQLPPASVDAVVTEPYLGPALRGTPRRAQIQQSATDLRKLYAAALTAFLRVLKNDGRVVMVFPRFVREGITTTLPEKSLATIGYERIRVADLLPQAVRTALTPEGNLVYARPDANIAREIVLLRKKQ